MGRRAWTMVALAALATVAAAKDGRPQGGPAGEALIIGLDHIPVAVGDLEDAAERYHRLGFVLKPGRPHENGIRNFHAKFPDGSELELITASQARDSLTKAYLRHLAAGDGPAFVSFYGVDQDSLAHRLDSLGVTYRRSGPLLTLAESDGLAYIFFGPRNQSSTDRPEHFRHPNGAEALIGVWLAADDLGPERRLLAGLGVPIVPIDARVPEPARVPAARLREGEVLFLPVATQRVPGRRIVGATLRVQSISATREFLEQGPWVVPPIIAGADAASLFLPPDLTHGLWLEFRQDH